MKIVMFKTRKPRTFTYRPRYFDPEKEALEERRRAREQRLSDSGERLREEMTRKWHRKAKRKSNTTTLVYIAVLALLLFLIFG
ncbi:MAG: hypothetical protein ACQESX_01400 [Bacteroidota bacterium]